MSVDDGNNKTTEKDVTINALPLNVTTNALVLLSAISSNPNCARVTYVWKQTKGTPVVLIAAGLGCVKFFIPNGASDVTLEFEVEVSDGIAAPVVRQITVPINYN